MKSVPFIPSVLFLIPCLVIQSLYLSWQTHTSVFQSQVCLPFSKCSAPTSARVPEFSSNYRTKEDFPPYPHDHPLSGCPKQAGQSTLEQQLPNLPRKSQSESPSHRKKCLVMGRGSWSIAKYFPHNIMQTLQGCFITTLHLAWLLNF